MARYKFETDGDYINFIDSVNTLIRLHNSSRCISWSYDDTNTGIKFRIGEFDIHTEDITDISFDGDACSVQADFQTGIEAMFPDMAGGGGGIESVVAGSGVSVDNTDPANPVVSATGGGSYLVASVTLTDAQIKALPTDGFEIIPAQGSGKVILLMGGFAEINATAGAYTNVSLDGSTLKFVYNIFGADTQMYFNTGDNFYTTAGRRGIPANLGFDAQNQNITSFDNKKISINQFNTGDNFTGGNAANTLTVTVYYVVVDL